MLLNQSYLQTWASNSACSSSSCLSLISNVIRFTRSFSILSASSLVLWYSKYRANYFVEFLLSKLGSYYLRFFKMNINYLNFVTMSESLGISKLLYCCLLPERVNRTKFTVSFGTSSSSLKIFQNYCSIHSSYDISMSC